MAIIRTDRANGDKRAVPAKLATERIASQLGISKKAVQRLLLNGNEIRTCFALYKYVPTP